MAGAPSTSDVAQWTADSIDTGGAFAWPQTGTAYYACVPSNTGAGLGSFFVERANAVNPPVAAHCLTDCANEDLGTADMQMIVDDLAAGCVPRHMP